jgi:hypothetical protein
MTRIASPLARAVAVAALAGAVLAAGSVHAEPSDEDVAKMTDLNKQAVAAYQAANFNEARQILKQALDLADSAGLAQHPITARTHVHMGIVIIGGFNQRDLGIKQFRKALEIQPTIRLTKALVTPDLAAAFAEAKSGPTSGPTAAATAAPEPAAPAPPPERLSRSPAPAPNALVHDPVTKGKKGSAISITVGVDGSLKFSKVVLAYRPDGATEFLGRQMTPVAEGRYGAEIPPSATAGDTVAYYVEADDIDGDTVASRGSVDAPLVIELVGPLPPAVSVHKTSDDAQGQGEADEDGPDHRFFVGLVAGTGFGWATGDGDTNHDVAISPAGVAQASLLQVAPELGYWTSASLMLSLQLRYQHVSGTTDVYVGGKDYHTANYAFAAFAKATWKFGSDQNKLRPFFSLAAGAGQIRHVVTLKQLGDTCGKAMNEACVDTIAAGPVLLGPGGGVFYDLSDRWALVLQGNSVLAFPNFTVNLDVDIGVAMGF